MSSPEEREKARQRLRGLAESVAPAPADSSGYVDLSAYSASDPNWVEHALARSRSGEAASPAPILDSRALGSVAPVEVTRITEPPPPPRRSRRRAAMMTSAALAGATAALLLALHPFGGAGAKRSAVTNEPAATPAVAPPPAMPAPTTASTAESATPSTSATGEATGTRVASPPPRLPAMASPTRPRAPARPASRPIPRARPGGDALTNAMLQSLAAPSASKK